MNSVLAFILEEVKKEALIKGQGLSPNNSRCNTLDLT
jgi:hypothetical protein